MAYEIILGRDEGDRAKFGLTGTILLGKHYVQMGQTTALSQPIYLDLNKAHVVFLCGKRGSGKCVTGDTIVTLADGREVSIKDLERESDDVKILGLDKNLKVVPVPKTGFYKRTVDEVIRLTLRSGRQITLTPEHPLLTINGWQPAVALARGSRIATPRKLPCNGATLLTEAEIKILAYLIAEGHVKSPLFFTNSDKKIVEDLTVALEQFDPVLELTTLGKNYCYKINSRREKRRVLHFPERDERGQWMKGGHQVVEKRKIRRWLEAHGLYGKLSREKNIPSAIFQTPNHQISLFLNRLFSCDGSIYHQNGWEVSYSSMSKKLVQQVQGLLLRFEILSKLREKKAYLNGKCFYSFELVINGENVTNFLQQVGFFGKKTERQEKALKDLQIIKHNPNIDTIPREFWDAYRPESWIPVGKALGYKSPKAARSSIAYSPSRQKLLLMGQATQDEGVIRLAESDIFWDEISSIEHILEEVEVYDITVPEFHNFIANNVIIHNSYAMGVIAEGISQLPAELGKKISVIMLDTMGIYWSMKYPNHKDESLLKEWGMEGKGITNLRIFTPAGFYKKYKEQGIPTDASFSIKPSELSPEDWWLTFDLQSNDPIAVFIERIVLELRKEGEDYAIEDIVEAIKKDEKEEQHVKQAAENRFVGVESWGVFSNDATPIKDLAAGGQITILDLSCYAVMPNGWKIKHLVLGLVTSKLFIQRMIARKDEEYQSIYSAIHYFGAEEKPEEMPIVWLLIDEAHEFMPATGKTAATDALITLLREGRQPGVAMVMATQQPGKIHTDAMTQSDVIIAHRLTAKIDTDALGSLLQSYLRGGLDKELGLLPRVAGAAIALDDVNERMYPMRVRPRVSWHGGGAPGIIEMKKKVYEF